MALQKTFLTALPNGYTVDKTGIKVSAILSARLDPEASPANLGTFPDFHDWPAMVAKSYYTITYGTNIVKINGAQVTGKNCIDTSLGVPSSAAWTRLFTMQTPILVPNQKKYTNSKVVSFPVHELSELIHNLVVRLSLAHSDNLPTEDAILNDPSWTSIRLAVETLQTNVSSLAKKENLSEPEALFSLFKETGFNTNNPVYDTIAKFITFYTPPSKPSMQDYSDSAMSKHGNGKMDEKDSRKAKAKWQTFERTPLPDKSDFKNQIDFHQRLSAMNQYPLMLRTLGLVVDFILEPALFSYAPDKILTISQELPASPTSFVKRARSVAPGTHTCFSKTAFNAVSRPSPQPQDLRIKQGLLDLDNCFDLVQMDVDGAGHKVINFCKTLSHKKSKLLTKDFTTRLSNEAGSPALRNAGFTLVHTGRGKSLTTAIKAGSTANDTMESAWNTVSGPPVIVGPSFYAEDLVRGFRVDIWDGISKKWRSLCERKSCYIVGEGGDALRFETSEEGMIRMGATKSADPTSNGDLVFLHESMVSWNGWNLCVPQPFKVLTPRAGLSNDAPSPDNMTKDNKPETVDGLAMTASFSVIPGRLPRLRYGRQYWIRGRVVDLAGNSLAFSEKNIAWESPQSSARHYLRYEPVLPPSLALVKPKSSPLVVPFPGESMDRMAIRTLNVTPDLNTVVVGDNTIRNVVPPKTTQREAEHHGAFDSGKGVDPSFYTMLITLDAELAHVELDTPGPGTSAACKTRYAVLDQDALIPYLPDPLCTVYAARIIGLPTWDADKIIEIPVYKGDAKWPDASPFQIKIYEAPSQFPGFDINTRILSIPLPKGERVVVRLSSLMKDNGFPVAGNCNLGLSYLGLWQEQKKEMNASGYTNIQKEAFTKKVVQGQQWTLTPWKNVEIVHATQKPLLSPDFVNDFLEKPEKMIGRTVADINFNAIVSLKTTTRIDMLAFWEEPVESPDSFHGENRHREDTAGSIKIVQGAYGDTLDYKLEPAKPDQIQVFRPSLRHEFNDTRYRRIEYQMKAVSCFREYMDPKILKKIPQGGGDPVSDDTHISVIGKPLRTWILNSTPPPSPQVLYIMPTFGWKRTHGAQGEYSCREGGGLRIYLNGSWNVSGYGEMLAIVLPQATITQDPETSPSKQPLKNFVTQWGNDPAWKSGFVSGYAPKRKDFLLARTQKDPSGKWLPSFANVNEADQPNEPFQVTDLIHPSMESGLPATSFVDIAPHDVAWDSDKNLWYCDVVVKPGTSYFPFIRLALARYQPASCYLAHLSNIVLADFMALAPDRFASVTPIKSLTPATKTFEIAVHGYSYTDSSGHQEIHTLNAAISTYEIVDTVSPRSIVNVWLEKLDESLGVDFGWKKVTATVDQNPMLFNSILKVASASKISPVKNKPVLSKAIVESMGTKFVVPVLWHGKLSFENISDSGKYRIAIAEYEEYLIDEPAASMGKPLIKGQRLVYTEYVEVS